MPDQGDVDEGLEQLWRQIYEARAQLGRSLTTSDAETVDMVQAIERELECLLCSAHCSRAALELALFRLWQMIDRCEGRQPLPAAPGHHER